MAPTEPGDDRSTVLVVDDEPETADLYADMLADDYAVRTAYSGEEALDLADDEVDVVLLDRRMPGLSGDEVLTAIRDRGLDCRVVMVTAIDPDVNLIDLPFDDYLVKPVSRDVVQDAVERMLAREAYDNQMQEVLALVSKMATLESKMDLDELEASDEYAALEERFTELREEIEALDPPDEEYAEFTSMKLRSLLR